MLEVEIPLELPVMTISSVALFPRAMVPLHIFEPRYRQMLEDVLGGDRMFCLAGQNDAEAEATGTYEPPFPIATVGVVRASQQNNDATSNLVLQGLARVRIHEIVCEEPYRIARLEPVEIVPGASEAALRSQAAQVIELLIALRKFQQEIPSELIDYLRDQEEPEAVIDLAAFAFCSDPQMKQGLLAELNICTRFSLFLKQLRTQRRDLELEAELRRGTGDDQIGLN